MIQYTQVSAYIQPAILTCVCWLIFLRIMSSKLDPTTSKLKKMKSFCCYFVSFFEILVSDEHASTKCIFLMLHSLDLKTNMEYIIKELVGRENLLKFFFSETKN